MVGDSDSPVLVVGDDDSPVLVVGDDAPVLVVGDDVPVLLVLDNLRVTIISGVADDAPPSGQGTEVYEHCVSAATPFSVISSTDFKQT